MFRFDELRNHSAIFLFLVFLSILAAFTEDYCSVKSQRRTVKGVYRLIDGKSEGLKICIVDGPSVRRNIYHEFLYGGNDERYLFNPQGEIWIDNSISAEEYSYTLAHELNERYLMANFRFTYTAAHDSSLKLERQMRLDDLKNASQHEAELKKVSPTDCDGIKQISTLEDSIKLNGIYLQLFDRRNEISIWIVDGSAVRKNIYPDFGLSGNAYVYHFIPKGEIWIDGQISCEETEFSIYREMIQQNLMAKGMNYDMSYQKALKFETKLRIEKAREASLRPPIRIPKQLDREINTSGKQIDLKQIQSK